MESNKLMVGAGSLLTINGILLLAAPARFATLRKASWTPARADAALDWLGGHDNTGRLIGAFAAAIGILLLAVGFTRTDPIR